MLRKYRRGLLTLFMTRPGMYNLTTTLQENSPAGNAILSLFGFFSEIDGGVIGVTCSPLDTSSSVGSECSQTAICCENNSVVGSPVLRHCSLSLMLTNIV